MLIYEPYICCKLLTAKLGIPCSIACVYYISETIYWTDAGHSTIEMARLNGSDRYVIASGDMEKPRSIVVDPVLG